MKHLLPARYVLTMLLACFMALGVQAEALKFYVSAQTGNDSRNGTSWNAAFKTLKAALKAAEANTNLEVNIYMAEGKYEVSDPVNHARAFYVLTREGQRLNIMGGFPKPGSRTLPTDTCNNNPKRYHTELVASKMMTQSIFRANNTNQAIILRGLKFNSANFQGGVGQGALITMDCNNCDNPYFEMDDCFISYYKSAGSGAIYFYGNMKNPKVKISRVEVLRGDFFGGVGGGFLAFSDLEKQTNTQLDLSYVTFHDIQHQGTFQGQCLIGVTNAGTPEENPKSYARLDHIQVNRNLGGTASAQMPTISLEGFENVSITNSVIHNTQAGDGGAIKVASFVNLLSENNQYYNNLGGDHGGAVYVVTGKQAKCGIDINRKRTAIFRNDQFYGNRSGVSLGKGDGGGLNIDSPNEGNPLSVQIENCNFNGNTTNALEAGALWINVAGKVEVKNSIFCNNTGNALGESGTGSGGAIRFAGANPLIIDGCYFSGNKTKKGGGALEIDIADKRFDVRNCVFVENTCTDGSIIGGIIYPSGGAISLPSGYGAFKNCKFVNNSSHTYGGAVSIRNNNSMADEPITFDNCEFDSNKSNNGGAIGQISNSHEVIVTNCVFKNNHAYGFERSGNGGGAICMLAGCKGTQLINNIFEGNTVVGKGGAVLALNAAFVKSSDNRYYNNEANQGGAICMNDASIDDKTSGLWSANDVFFGNVAKKGDLATNIASYTLPGSGGALSILLAQDKNCIIEKSTFVKNSGDGIKGRSGSGGAIFYLTRTGLLTGDNRFVIDRITNCTFFGNQGMSNDSKMSTTVWGADISSHKTGYSYIRIFDTKLQLASNMYKSNLQLDEQSNNTYSYNTDPGTPAEATPINGQGYTKPTSTEMGEHGEGMKVDCKEITERQEIDVTKPHADVTTSKKAPKTFVSYCADEENYWAMFQSIGGEGPFKFTYDVWKQKGRDIEKIVDGRTVETSKKRYKTPDFDVDILDYDKPIKDPQGNITGYESKGKKHVEGTWEYPDSVIVKGEDLFPKKFVKEGYVYTIIVKQMSDYVGETFTYDCVDYSLQRDFSQGTGAQIFFKPCLVAPGDLDWDNDGILNYVECPDLAEPNIIRKSGITLKPTDGKWVRYRENINTQQLFADIVNNENYLNKTPKVGRVLTLLPSVIGASSNTNDPFTIDLSDKFGYPAGTGAVVVTVRNYSIDNDRFMTGNANEKTIMHWEVGGTMQPYVLMQSTPASTFHKDNQFGINILTNENALSQTELYTSLTDDRYTVYEKEGTHKVIFNNEDAKLVNQVGLSYLNTEPGKKYFEFSQTPDKSGQVNTLVTLMLPCDTDMDGTPDFLDADSDNDGCVDAIEGGDNVTEDMVDDQGRIKGDEDKDGVPVAVNVGGKADNDGKQGQSAGSAYDEEENACGNNYWIGGVDNDFNKKENWTNDVPKDGQNIIFANNQPDIKGEKKVAERDMHLPAGKFISANKLVNNAPNEKFEKGATTKTAGHPAVVVPADGGLTVKSVAGFGTDGDKDKLVMKTSTDGKKVGTFILNNENACTTKVFASVEFKPLGKYLPGNMAKDDKDNTSPDFGNKVKAEFDWQYIGIPVKEVKKSPVFKGAKVRVYDEKKNDTDHYYQKWINVMPTDNMTAFKGYEIAPVLEGSDGVRQIQGELNFCNQEITLTRQADIVTASKAKGDDNAKRYGLGYNIVGNSFMAGVDIKNITLESGEDGVEMDKTVYIYTTGSWDDWKNQNGQSVKEKGGYEAVPIDKAGENGVTRTLSPMQGFMVKYNNPVYSTKTGTLTIPYTGLQSKSEPLRAKSFVMDGDFNRGSVMVTMDNGKVVDKFWTYQEEDATPAYDPQLEGEKLNMGEPSVFATTTDGKNVQISSLPSLIGSTFSVETAKGDTYNMELNAWSLNYQNLKLVDLKKKTVIPFNNGKARYFFMATVDGIEHNRFMFADTPETDFEKVMGAVTGIDNVSITLTKGEAELFNLSGAKIGTFSLPLDAKKLKGQVPTGVYLIKATDGTNVQTSKIVIE